VEDIVKIEQGARFHKVLKRLKLSQVALSQLTGLSQPLISQICTGNKDITRQTEKIITELLPDINMKWVFTGDGPMLFSDELKKNALPGVEESMAIYGTDPLDQLRRKLNEFEERISGLEQRVEALESV